MRALVLGGCGFIGSHVVDALVAAGHTVTVFDRGAERYREPVAGVEYKFGDFADSMALLEALSGIDIVYHLISTTFPGTANLDPRSDVSGNLVGTLGLLENMAATGVNRLVYLSSGGTVYGKPAQVPIPEDHPLRPINSYGIVKVAIESYLEMFRVTKGLQPVAIRAANPFGPRQGHTGLQGVIATFLRRIRDGQTIEIWGDGSVVRDYLHVADLANLCVLAGQSNYCGALNAGSGVGRSIKEIISAMEAVTGQSVNPDFRPARNIDIARSVLDSSLANDTLHWQTSMDFQSALADTWAWINTSDR